MRRATGLAIARRVAVAVGVTWMCASTSGCAAPSYTWTFELLSVNAAGTDSGNGGSGRNSETNWPPGGGGRLPATSFVTSADGSTIAFHSYASDLGPDDPGPNWDSDIYVRDLETRTTTLATVNAPGKDANNGDGSVRKMALSADGTKLAFASTAQNLVTADTNDMVDVFVRDLVAGTTELVSVNATGTDSANAGSNDFALSPDGTKIAFTSFATNLGPPNRGDTTESDIYLRDLVTGQTQLVSARPDGLDGVDISYQPVFSPQGDAVAFASHDPLSVEPYTDGWTDVFLFELGTGTLSLVSTAAAAPGPAQTLSFHAGTPVFRPDGGAVAYEVDMIYAIGPDRYRSNELELADLGSGAVELVSVHPVPAPVELNVEKPRDAQFSPDGTKVVFQTGFSHYGPTDTNRANDVYLRDLVADTTSLVTVNVDGTDAAGGSDPAFSPDGELIVFGSDSHALGSADDPDDGVEHVYLRELRANRTTLVAAGSSVPGVGFAVCNPTFVSGGTRIALVSESSNLGHTDTNGDSDLYLATGTRPSP